VNISTSNAKSLIFLKKIQKDVIIHQSTGKNTVGLLAYKTFLIS